MSESGEAICTGQCASGGCKVNSAGDGCECGNTCETTVGGDGQIQCGGACETGSVCTLEGDQCGCKPISPPTPTPTPSGPVVSCPWVAGEGYTTLGLFQTDCGAASSACQSAFSECRTNAVNNCRASGGTPGAYRPPNNDGCKKEERIGTLGVAINKCVDTCEVECCPAGSGGGGSGGGTGSGSGDGGTGGGGTGGPVVTSCAGKKQVGPETGAVSSDDTQCSQEECKSALDYCKKRLNEKCQGAGGFNPVSVQETQACTYDPPASTWLDGKCKISCKGCCNL